MRTNISENCVVVRYEEYVGMAELRGGEFCIMCYKVGHYREACSVLAREGHLSKDACAPLCVLNTLLRAARQVFSGNRFDFTVADERRGRIYERMLQRNNIPYTRDGVYFEAQI